MSKYEWKPDRGGFTLYVGGELLGWTFADDDGWYFIWDELHDCATVDDLREIVRKLDLMKIAEMEAQTEAGA